MLALGIPRFSTAAILLRGLIVWGVNPGSLLLAKHDDFVWGLIASMYLGNVVGLVVLLTKVLVRLYRAGAVCLGGADDRGVLRDPRLCDPERNVRHLADGRFGVVGYGFKKVGISLAPFSLGCCSATVPRTRYVY